MAFSTLRVERFDLQIEAENAMLAAVELLRPPDEITAR
jgi:hypothetical protein